MKHNTNVTFEDRSTEKILIIFYFVSHRMCIFLFNVDVISHTVKERKNNIIRVITIQLLNGTDGNMRFKLDFVPFGPNSLCRGSH